MIRDGAKEVYFERVTCAETETRKLDLSATNNDTTIVVTGHSDYKAIPPVNTGLIAEIEVLAYGSWNVDNASFPTAIGHGTVNVSMTTGAVWKPVDPTSEDLFGQSEARVKDPFFYPPIAPGAVYSLVPPFTLARF